MSKRREVPVYKIGVTDQGRNCCIYCWRDDCALHRIEDGPWICDKCGGERGLGIAMQPRQERLQDRGSGDLTEIWNRRQFGEALRANRAAKHKE